MLVPEFSNLIHFMTQAIPPGRAESGSWNASPARLGDRANNKPVGSGSGGGRRKSVMLSDSENGHGGRHCGYRT